MSAGTYWIAALFGVRSPRRAVICNLCRGSSNVIAEGTDRVALRKAGDEHFVREHMEAQA